ncbi:MAG: hypothetical protein ACI9R3_005946 [Verrucomicrobiales bacterium]|jgi:hypothetical protein
MKSLIFACLAAVAPLASGAPEVITTRAPEKGIQPVAESDAAGNVHVVYFQGDAAHGDLYYAVRPKGSSAFGKGIRVNSSDGSSIAMGTIRGAQLALGREGYVHVVWNGSSKATPGNDHHRAPMLYARSTDGGKSFEPERDLITKAYGLDGGGAIAADQTGKVDVFWHAGSPDGGETGRQIWVTRSSDDGKSFAAEVPAWDKPTGVCGCCGMTAGASGKQSWVLYRSATEKVDRDIYLLHSRGGNAPFSGTVLDRWKTESCPMSAMALSFAGGSMAAAWEAKGGDVAYAIIGTEIKNRVPHGKKKRKFPDIALAPDGHALLTWIDGGGWKKEGTLAWQLFAPDGSPIGTPMSGEKSAAWSKPAVVFDGEAFVIIY